MHRRHDSHKRYGNVSAVYNSACFLKHQTRPLIDWRVPAGFPSPAEDYIENGIDLSRELIRNPLATFYIRVMGDSMEPLIQHGALLVVDYRMTPQSGDIVLAKLCGEFCVKRYEMKEGVCRLVSENEIYEPILITEEMDFEIRGVVLHAIHTFK